MSSQGSPDATTAGLVPPHMATLDGGETRRVGRAAVSSLVATAVDGIIYETSIVVAGAVAARWYPVAAMAGAIAGAITHFTLSRSWVFRATRSAVRGQMLRYAVASGATLLLLQLMLWIAVGLIGIDPGVAWLPAKVLAWGLFSYPIQRWLVFAEARP